MIPVTKPFLPPKQEYEALLEGIWENHWLTNMGPLGTALENKLKEFLGLQEALIVTNGTIALQFAIKALALKGEIITTPYSYVATSSSIIWEGCLPVYVDIDRDSLNIDPTKIEAAITERTSAILATHIFGNPCDVAAIQEVADRHRLKVIYDGAHAFGVQIEGNSIFNFGDVATCSFHATKIFHTGEGGLVVAKDPGLVRDLFYMRNFGHDGPVRYYDLGINGKNSEFHAALGLANLKYMREITDHRKTLSEHYDEKLQGLKVRKPLWHKGSETNYAYYPLVFESESQLISCMETLETHQIFGRRYFYPTLPQSLPYLTPQSLPLADDLSTRVFCLPLYFDLSLEEVDAICELLLCTETVKR